MDFIFQQLFELFVYLLEKPAKWIYKKIKPSNKTSDKRNELSILILSMTILSCSNKTEPLDNEKYLDSISIVMQQQIDSASILYQKAIDEKLNGVPDSVIIIKYKNRIKNLENRSIATFNNSTEMAKTGRITQTEYESIEKKIFMDSIQSKIYQIEKIGISFE